MHWTAGFRACYISDAAGPPPVMSNVSPHPHMHKYSVHFFVTGILLQLVAILGSNATDIPWLARLIAPTYSRAQSGIVRLESSAILRSTDQGHHELSNIVQGTGIRFALVTNTPAFMAGTNDSIVLGGTMYLQDGRTYPRTIQYSFSSPVVWCNDFDQVRERVASLKTRRLLIFRLSLFILGTALDTFAFALKRKPTQAQHGPQSNSSREANELRAERNG